MILERFLSFSLAAGCLLGWGCVSTVHTDGNTKTAARDQILALETLSAQERAVAAFAGSCGEIRRAVVKIRPSLAVVLLTPEAGKKISRNTIDKLNAAIQKMTGLMRNQIIMKTRAVVQGEK